jgi:hypothetical protein
MRNIALVAVTLMTSSLAAAPALAGAGDFQILPGGKVIFVNLEGTTEFCIDPQDRRTCRVLSNRCDFIVADPQNRQITEPEPISLEAILAHGGPGALPLLQDNSELVRNFTFGANECNLKQTAKAHTDNDPPDSGSPN